MQRRTFIASGAALAGGALSATPFAFAQAKPETTEGGRSRSAARTSFYYLPLTIAERWAILQGRRARRRDLRLRRRRARRCRRWWAAAPTWSPARTSTRMHMQAQEPDRSANSCCKGRAPQIVLAVSKKTMPNYKSIADLKGKKIGVTAPGSSTDDDGELRAREGAGSSASDVAFIGVGARRRRDRRAAVRPDRRDRATSTR